MADQAARHRRFTALTYFVANYVELVVIRTIAGSFAVAELAMAAVLVREQTPARARGFLYSIVNGGYALGVPLASACCSPRRAARLGGALAGDRPRLAGGVFIVWFVIFQATNGIWSGAGQGYWPESFPTRVRGTAVGWLGAMFALGQLVGSGIWTIMIASAGPTATWMVVAVGLAFGQYLTLALRHIDPNQELEEVVT